jgi:type I restriction enzyme, S subunit
MPEILPSNWSWVKLGDVCKVKGGFAFKSKDYKKEGVPLVRISNIDEKEVSLEDCVYIQPDDESKIKEFILHKGDILIALSGATTGKYGVYNLDQKAFLNQRIGRLHFNGSVKIIPSYVYLYLEIIRSEILKTAYGAAQPNISPSEIADFPLPLPPLPEQKKIVEKIEELFSGLDSGVASLKKAKEQIKLYWQSVLASAFNGKLIGNEKIDEKTGLPEGWKLVKLGEIIKVSSGKGLTSARMLNDGKYSVYGGNGISGFYNEFMFEEARLIIGRVGAKCGVMHITKPKSWVTDNALVVDLLTDEVSIKFLYHSLGFHNLNKLSVSTAQPVISGSKIYPYKIKLPPQSQQTQIVEEIEKRFSEADNLEKAIDESLGKSESLRQSILKKAFEGKLV